MTVSRMVEVKLIPMQAGTFGSGFTARFAPTIRRAHREHLRQTDHGTLPGPDRGVLLALGIWTLVAQHRLRVRQVQEEAGAHTPQIASLLVLPVLIVRGPDSCSRLA